MKRACSRKGCICTRPHALLDCEACISCLQRARPCPSCVTVLTWQGCRWLQVPGCALRLGGGGGGGCVRAAGAHAPWQAAACLSGGHLPLPAQAQAPAFCQGDAHDSSILSAGVFPKRPTSASFTRWLSTGFVWEHRCKERHSQEPSSAYSGLGTVFWMRRSSALRAAMCTLSPPLPISL